MLPRDDSQLETVPTSSLSLLQSEGRREGEGGEGGMEGGRVGGGGGEGERHLIIYFKVLTDNLFHLANNTL